MLAPLLSSMAFPSELRQNSSPCRRIWTPIPPTILTIGSGNFFTRHPAALNAYAQSRRRGTGGNFLKAEENSRADKILSESFPILLSRSDRYSHQARPTKAGGRLLEMGNHYHWCAILVPASPTSYPARAIHRRSPEIVQVLDLSRC